MLFHSRFLNLLIIFAFSFLHIYFSDNKFLIGGDSILPIDENFNYHWKGFWNSSISNGSFLFTFYRPLELFYDFFFIFTDNFILVSNLVISSFKFICGIFLLFLLQEISKKIILIYLFIFYYLYSPVFFNLDVLPIFYYNLPILCCFIYFGLIKNQINFISVISYIIFFYFSLNELPQPKYFLLGNLVILYFLFLNYFKFKKSSIIMNKKNYFLIINVIFLNLLILFFLYFSFVDSYVSQNINEISLPNLEKQSLRYDQYLNNLIHSFRFFHNNTVLLPYHNNFFISNFFFQIIYFIPFFISLIYFKNDYRNFVSPFIPLLIFFISINLASNFPIFALRDLLLLNFTPLSFLRTSSGINSYIFVMFYFYFFYRVSTSKFNLNFKILFVFIFVFISTFHFLSKKYYLGKFEMSVPESYFQAKEFINTKLDPINDIFLIDSKGGYVSLDWGYQGPRSIYNFIFNNINITYNELNNNSKYLIYDKSSSHFKKLTNNGIIFENKYLVIYLLNPLSNLIYSNNINDTVNITKKTNYSYNLSVTYDKENLDSKIFFNTNFNKYWILIKGDIVNNYKIFDNIEFSKNYQNINSFMTNKNNHLYILFLPSILEYIIYFLTTLIILSLYFTKKE